MKAADTEGPVYTNFHVVKSLFQGSSTAPGCSGFYQPQGGPPGENCGLDGCSWWREMIGSGDGKGWTSGAEEGPGAEGVCSKDCTAGEGTAASQVGAPGQEQLRK